MSRQFPPIPRFVTPLPDENCYSILCRCAVHAAMSTAKFCHEMFGRQRNLYNYLWQPFRPEEVSQWFDDADERIPIYVQKHSCIPYRYSFVEKRSQNYLDDWNAGEPLSNGHYKRVTRMLGYRFWTKEYLYYCPECVRNDRREYGETYWHMIPQLPGVTVCPIHMVPLEKSDLLVGNTKYELLPAEYWLQNQEARKETIAYDDLRIAMDSKWMMENGWHMDSGRFTGKLDKGLSPWQYEKVEAVLARFSRQQNPKSETLYRILLAVEKGVSLSEIQ